MIQADSSGGPNFVLCRTLYVDSFEIVHDMIRFCCKKCGYKLSIQNKYSDELVKCPKCHFAGVMDEEAAEDLREKSPATPKKSEITDRKLIVGVSAVAIFIVAGIIIVVGIVPSYKLQKARKFRDLQSQEQIDDIQPRRQNISGSEKDVLKHRSPESRRGPVKWKRNIAISSVIVIFVLVVLALWRSYCPICHKVWAMKRITPCWPLRNVVEYQCEFCGYIKIVLDGN